MRKCTAERARINKHIGESLRMARNYRGLTQANIGAFLGVSFQQIQKYEKGKNSISASSLYILSKALKFPLDYFFAGEMQ